MPVSTLAKTTLFNSEGKMLVMKRSRADMLRPGKLDLPGGSVEPGENVVSAAVREIFEETGINLSEQDLKIVYGVATDATDQESALIRILFTALTPSLEIVMDHEHEAYFWMSVDEAIEALKGRPFGDGIVFAKKHGLLPA